MLEGAAPLRNAFFECDQCIKENHGGRLRTKDNLGRSMKVSAHLETRLYSKLNTSLAARGQAIVGVLQYTSVKKAFKDDDLRLKVMSPAIYYVVCRVQAACKAADKYNFDR